MRNFRKLAAFCTAAALCTGMLPTLPASAETWTPLTDTIEWQIDDTGTLTVRGTGEMPDYSYSGAIDCENEVCSAMLQRDCSPLIMFIPIIPAHRRSWKQ